MQPDTINRAGTVSRTSKWVWIAFALIVGAAFVLRLKHLGQLSVKDLDEVFHALVARSMTHNPLYPMLYERPFLPFDYTNWLSNHIWLHKPPVAMWQMALSMTLFGDSNFAMRLPSLLLSTGTVALTFLIGRSLCDARAGLIASAFQALSPAITRLVHGQVFSDHVDIALLYYCELAVMLLIRAAHTGSTKQAGYAGAAMGAAFLSKSFPCMFVLGLAVLLILKKRFIRDETPFALTGIQLKRFLWSALLVAVPWTLWCGIAFPREFFYEQIYVFRHLTEDIEAFSAPWDRLAFDYLFRALLEWYPLALFALGYVGMSGWRLRDAHRLFVFFWAMGVLVPHLLAVSKTPSATLIGWPAIWLAVGMVIADATRGKRVALCVVFVAAALLSVWFVFPPTTPIPKERATSGAILLAEWRVVAQAGLLVMVAGLAYVLPGKIRVAPRWAAIVVAVVLLWPIARHARIAYLTAADVSDGVAYPILGAFVEKNAQPEAVFFVENLARHEHLIAMWWLHRTCYPLRPDHFEADLNEVLKNGGTPFVLSRAKRAEPVLISVPSEGTIYRLDRPVLELPSPTVAPAGND